MGLSYDVCINKFANFTKSKRNFISNANDDLSQVTDAKTVKISPSRKISHTPLILSLSQKLISISQLTKNLNFFATIYPNFFSLHDIHSKEVIRRGTEQGRLYFVDDLQTGRSN